MSSRTPATWNDYLKSSDTDNIWKELHRICAQHKLSRYSSKFDQLVEEGKFNKFTDLTQDLFLKLLEKDRFQHYIDAEMSDADIEMEISQIELSNILTLELRKRYPEAYRMSRRVLQILQTNTKFKKIQAKVNERTSNNYYILSTWSSTTISSENMDERVSKVKSVSRDIRMAGCAGDSQIIISNVELANLIESVLFAADCPLTVKEIRKYVLSKLTIMDINITPIESYVDSDDKPMFEVADTRNTPEQDLLSGTEDQDLVEKVNLLLATLKDSVKGKDKQYTLVLNILRLYYLTPKLSQWDVSRQLNVSDSLVSGYRKMIDPALHSLGFSDISQARRFKQVLSNEITKELLF